MREEREQRTSWIQRSAPAAIQIPTTYINNAGRVARGGLAVRGGRCTYYREKQRQQSTFAAEATVTAIAAEATFATTSTY